MNDLPRPGTERFLVFSASLRAGSHNTRLARLAARTLEARGGQVDLASIREFDGPSYDADREAAEGFPHGAEEFRRRLEANDALVIASPEYNASVPGLLKNLIDWTSRYSPQPLNERQSLLLSASPSLTGGNRGLWALRIPLEHLGTRVYPAMFSLAQAHQAFAEDGRLADSQLQQRLEDTIADFMALVEATKHYAHAKSHWVEFLGEHPGEAADRIE
jgi:chromate reductase, NAD(P)H dehydrogenase (quinone)